VRELLPGDSGYGDPLSTGGAQPSQQLGRRLSTLTAERPSMLGEIGLSALQVWESISEDGRDQEQRELAILFTDLVGFSSWALEAGDTMAVELLREVGLVIEPPVAEHGGSVVKRLGDGLMAVFEDPVAAVAAALDACEGIAAMEIDGTGRRCAPAFTPGARGGSAAITSAPTSTSRRGSPRRPPAVSCWSPSRFTSASRSRH